MRMLITEMFTFFVYKSGYKFAYKFNCFWLSFLINYESHSMIRKSVQIETLTILSVFFDYFDITLFDALLKNKPQNVKLH